MRNPQFCLSGKRPIGMRSCATYCITMYHSPTSLNSENAPTRCIRTVPWWCHDDTKPLNNLLWPWDCGLATPYGDIDLGHHLLWWWFVAWRHQAWTNVDLSPVGYMVLTRGQFQRKCSRYQFVKYVWKYIYEINFTYPRANELILLRGV